MHRGEPGDEARPGKLRTLTTVRPYTQILDTVRISLRMFPAVVNVRGLSGNWVA